ncbi:hypothetical protein C8C76_13525 [Halanaerobium saccharolyticum]|jgi:hypothetical protein|uniref:Uncharacterized protein n=1 Tax=Halanaerobium saccharolyticum TaxID=43595 RepID=A0A2T5RGR4_9FIRM|nr:hypothetical protein [Halanaerobium saccharolyticum]PTV93935.1 hypothetical protein C8C76_13525 [Halanaerobium saccharolyticum]TDP93093.1 hypothetical protein C7957_11366 [Halanaerobium saccharolyticum]
MKKLLVFLHFFVGIGALFGGGGAILNPLHIIYFTIGGSEMIISLRLIMNERRLY